MQDSRNNIMFRKHKAYNGRNDSHLDAEHQAEQARLEQLRKRREEISEQRRMALFGSSEEKGSLKQRIAEEAQLQQIMREQRISEERQREQLENQRMEEHRRRMVDMERQREVERREKMRQMQEENRMAALAKSSDRIHRKVTEDRKDRETIYSNVSSYNPNVF